MATDKREVFKMLQNAVLRGHITPAIRDLDTLVVRLRERLKFAITRDLSQIVRSQEGLAAIRLMSAADRESLARLVRLAEPEARSLASRRKNPQADALARSLEDLWPRLIAMTGSPVGEDRVSTTIEEAEAYVVGLEKVLQSLPRGEASEEPSYDDSPEQGSPDGFAIPPVDGTVAPTQQAAQAVVAAQYAATIPDVYRTVDALGQRLVQTVRSLINVLGKVFPTDDNLETPMRKQASDILERARRLGQAVDQAKVEIQRLAALFGRHLPQDSEFGLLATQVQAFAATNGTAPTGPAPDLDVLLRSYTTFVDDVKQIGAGIVALEDDARRLYAVPEVTSDAVPVDIQTAQLPARLPARLSGLGGGDVTLKTQDALGGLLLLGAVGLGLWFLRTKAPA